MSSKNKASEIIARMRARGLLPKNTNAPAVMPDMSSGSNKEDHHEVGNNEQPESYPTATADVTYHVRSAATGIYNPYDPNHPRPLAASESQALDPKFQKASPELATLNRPQVFPEQQTMAHVAGQMLNSDAARGLGGLLGNHGTIPSALMTGALGYGGGKLIDWITGLLDMARTPHRISERQDFSVVAVSAMHGRTLKKLL